MEGFLSIRVSYQKPEPAIPLNIPEHHAPGKMMPLICPTRVALIEQMPKGKQNLNNKITKAQSQIVDLNKNLADSKAANADLSSENEKLKKEIDKLSKAENK